MLYQNLFKLNWYQGDHLVFEDGKIHTYRRYSRLKKKMVGDDLIPFQIKGSTIIIPRRLHKYSRGRSKSYISYDTLHYQFVNHNGLKLIMGAGGAPFSLPLVMQLKENKYDFSNKIGEYKKDSIDFLGYVIGGRIANDSLIREDRYVPSKYYDYHSLSDSDYEIKFPFYKSYWNVNDYDTLEGTIGTRYSYPLPIDSNVNNPIEFWLDGEYLNTRLVSCTFYIDDSLPTMFNNLSRYTSSLLNCDSLRILDYPDEWIYYWYNGRVLVRAATDINNRVQFFSIEYPLMRALLINENMIENSILNESHFGKPYY